MARNAEKNNDKLFPIFRKNLSDGVLNTYSTTADKLTMWLSRDKAYYLHARPMIVDLLETAHAQVRRSGGTPDQPFHISRCPESLMPWAGPFIKLMRTVAQFYSLFEEPHLQARLRALLQTVDVALPRSTHIQQPLHSPTNFESSMQHVDSPHGTSPTSPHVPSHFTSIPGHVSPGYHASSPGGFILEGRGSPVQLGPSVHPFTSNRLPDRLTRPLVNGESSEAFGRPISRGSVSEILPRTHLHPPLSPFASPASASATSGLPLAVSVPFSNLKSAMHPPSRSSSASGFAGASNNASELAEAGPSTSTKKPKAKVKKRLSIQDDFILADLQWFETTKRQSTEQSPVLPSALPSTPTLSEQKVEASATVWNGAENASTSISGQALDTLPTASTDDQLTTQDKVVAVKNEPLDLVLPESVTSEVASIAPVEVSEVSANKLSIHAEAQTASESETPAAAKSFIDNFSSPLPSPLSMIKRKVTRPRRSLPGLKIVPLKPDIEEEQVESETLAQTTSPPPSMGGPDSAMGNDLQVVRQRSPERATSQPLIDSLDIQNNGTDIYTISPKHGTSEGAVSPSQIAAPLPVEMDMTITHQASPDQDVIPQEIGFIDEVLSSSVFHSHESPTSLLESHDIRPKDAEKTSPQAHVSGVGSEDHTVGDMIPEVYAATVEAEHVIQTLPVSRKRTRSPSMVMNELTPRQRSRTFSSSPLLNGSPLNMAKYLQFTEESTSSSGQTPLQDETQVQDVTHSEACTEPVPPALPGPVQPGLTNDGPSHQPTVSDVAIEMISPEADQAEASPDTICPPDPIGHISVQRSHSPGTLTQEKEASSAHDFEGRVTPIADALSTTLGNANLQTSDTSSEEVATNTTAQSGTAPPGGSISDSDEQVTSEAVEEGEISDLLQEPVPSPSRKAADIVATMMTSPDIIPSKGPNLDAPANIVGAEAVWVIGCTRGNQDPDLTFEFDVSEDQAALVAQWDRRYKAEDDVASSLCLSFASYSFAECVNRTRNNPDMSMEELTVSISTTWPTDGRLWADLKNAQKHRNFMLSPPFMPGALQPASQTLVDLSPAVAPGNNVLRVHQLKDHSDYIFSLRLQHPTPSQLQELRERRARETDWRKWLQALRTFEMPKVPSLEDVTIIDS